MKFNLSLQIIFLVLITSLTYSCKPRRDKVKTKDDHSTDASADSENRSEAGSNAAEIVESMSCIKSETECLEFKSFTKDRLKEFSTDCLGKWTKSPCPSKNLIGYCSISSKFSSRASIKFSYFTDDMDNNTRIQKTSMVIRGCRPPDIFTSTES